MKNKILLITTILIIATLVASACGGTTAPSEEAAPAVDKTTVKIWTHQNTAFLSGYTALADKYMGLHPDVEIIIESFDYDTFIQTLQTSLPAKTEADILTLFGSWVCSYSEGGYLASVPESVITVPEAEEKYFNSAIGGYACDGRLYGIPQEFNIEYGAVLVNTNLAKEAGVAVDGWADWDEFIADAKKLTVVQDGVMTRAGFNFTGSDGIATMFHSLYLQYGGQYLTDGIYTVNTREGQKTLELMKRLVDEGLDDPILFNDEENWVGDSYFAETSAIGLVGPWAVPEYSGDYPEVADATVYVPLPSVGEEPVFAAASGWGMSVSVNSKVQDVAWDFVKFVTLDADNALEWNIASGTLPALKEETTGEKAAELVEKFPFFEPFLDLLQYGVFEGHFPDRDFVWYEVTYPRVLEFLQGISTSDETLETIQTEVRGSF
ncbi:MAG: extracellular solute-binding protein [Anaerolineaceae bacterium]|nr:extracellular solute-binding protein [Anaerolineaceae bacterium]